MPTWLAMISPVALRKNAAAPPFRELTPARGQSRISVDAAVRRCRSWSWRLFIVRSNWCAASCLKIVWKMSPLVPPVPATGVLLNASSFQAPDLRR